MSATEWSLTARWIFPVDGPPLERGVVTIAGDRIVSVEPHGTRTADRDLGNVAILPGLVNAHTHLDLSGARGKCPPTPEFTDWLRAVIKFRQTATKREVAADTREGLTECLASGTTLIGDVSAQGVSWSALANAPVRAVVYWEVIGLSRGRAEQSMRELQDWLCNHPATSTCKAGVSPHAPYSVRSELFSASAALGLPVVTHLAETTAELELLVLRTGPFVEFLKEMNVWDPEGLMRGHQDVLQLLTGQFPLAIAHGNYLYRDCTIPRNASLVYCPRTHAAFGHDLHPFRKFLKRRVNVALGTDSLASNPDLDVLGEARFVHVKRPYARGRQILRMATLSGAEALGWADETGSLTPGKSADFIVLPLPDETKDDPHRLILESTQTVQAVVFRGQVVHGALA
jgi:cytosine/adenosine deaminase-related metal-dependent hydrolase